ncbi:hypothetical protein D7004_03465 [Pedobacter jejuensis]|uniref:Uncharacterized protein n=2 Tax=Pedobacter jejuensis TaxID=1268550 RepID=A0A3N0C1B7_9SPHI|nr:hypothetical protein D7004_03465 [Pedobacter jejuensis]
MKLILYLFLAVFSCSAKAQIASHSQISNLRITNNHLPIYDSSRVDKDSIYQFRSGKNKMVQRNNLLLKSLAEIKQEQSNSLPYADNLVSSKSQKVIINSIKKRDLLFRDTDVKPELIYPKH